MDQQIRAAGKLDGRFAEHGVGAIDDAHTGPFLTAEAGAVDAATVLQGHRFTPLQLGVHGAGRDVQFPCFLNVEATGQGFCSYAVGVGRHSVDERVQRTVKSSSSNSSVPCSAAFRTLWTARG